jgi:protein gp37
VPTGIGWTGETGNVVVGCDKAGEECENCYAIGMAYRLQQPNMPYYGLNLVKKDPKTGRLDWTGEVVFRPGVMEKIKSWKKPRLIFIASMGDVFHAKVKYTDLETLFNLIRETPRHIFQLLTKRVPNMARFLNWYCARHNIAAEDFGKVFSNLWLGVSAGVQKTATARLNTLTQIPQSIAVRFLSAEPLVGKVEIGEWLASGRLNWVITGGESGSRARRLKWDWARSLRDECVAAGIPFFFKQEGTPAGQSNGHGSELLDEVEWKQFPPQAERVLSLHVAKPRTAQAKAGKVDGSANFSNYNPKKGSKANKGKEIPIIRVASR